jgi:hypothetical protein
MATPTSGIMASKKANSSAIAVRRTAGRPAIPSASATPNGSIPSGSTTAISLTVVPWMPAAYGPARKRLIA